jgi:hypothetical protein
VRSRSGATGWKIGDARHVGERDELAGHRIGDARPTHALHRGACHRRRMWHAPSVRARTPLARLKARRFGLHVWQGFRDAPPYAASFASATRLCLTSQRTDVTNEVLIGRGIGVDRVNYHMADIAITKIRQRVMSRLSLPACSLRGQPASLRTVADRAQSLLRKRLVWRDMSVIRPTISGIEPIFLPALRERVGAYLLSATRRGRNSPAYRARGRR